MIDVPNTANPTALYFDYGMRIQDRVFSKKKKKKYIYRKTYRYVYLTFC